MAEGGPRGEEVATGSLNQNSSGRVRDWNRADEEVMGWYGVQKRNVEGQMVVDLAKLME